MQAAAAPPRVDLVPRPLVSAGLCAALLAATAWAVLAAGWAQNAGGAVVVAIAATIEAALLARAAVPRWIALALAPLLMLAAIVPTTLGSMPFDGDPTLGHTVTRYAQALFGGLGASADWPFTVGLCAVLWLCGYWVAWLSMRERRGVLAVVPVFAVLATNVLNAHSVDNVALPECLAVFFSLMVVADAHLDAVESRSATHRVIALPGTRSRFALSVAVMSVLLTVAALLIPSLTSVDVSSHLFPGSSNGSGGPTVGTGLGSGTGTIEFNGATQPGGALVSHPRTVLSYATGSGAPAYLGVVADTLFSAGNWYPDHPGDAPDGFGWEGVPFTAGALPRDSSSADGAVAHDTARISATITMQASDVTGNTPWSPVVGEPLTLNQTGIAYGLDSSGSGLLTVEAVQLDAGIDIGTRVQTTGTVSIASPAQLRAAGMDYPAFSLGDTQLIDDGSNSVGVIHQLALQWTRGLSDPYDQATAIEAHLRNPSFFTYTLKPPDTPPSEWPIVYFLTTSHRGYCQYFASAMGAMLRSLGIPTRLINGYGPGSPQNTSGAGIKPGGSAQTQIVTTSDAHTWVEAFFPGYGWIPFEPTPPSSAGDYVTFPRGSAAAAGPLPSITAPSPAASFKPGFGNPPALPRGAAPSTAHGPSVGFVFEMIAAGLGVIALGLVVWLSLPRSLPGAWRRLETLGIAWGMRRRPWETHRDYARRFRAAKPRVSAALDEMATLAGRAEFSRDGVDRSARRRALASWRRVLVAAPRLTWSLRRSRAHI